MKKESAWPSDLFDGTLPEIGQLRVLRQFEFPDEYDSDLDHMMGSDINFLILHEEKATRKVLEKYFGCPQPEFPDLANWFEKANDDQIFQILRELLYKGRDIGFSGYRVCIKLCPDGLPCLFFELFYKSPKSETVVFTKNACRV